MEKVSYVVEARETHHMPDSEQAPLLFEDTRTFDSLADAMGDVKERTIRIKRNMVKKGNSKIGKIYSSRLGPKKMEAFLRERYSAKMFGGQHKQNCWIVTNTITLRRKVEYMRDPSPVMEHPEFEALQELHKAVRIIQGLFRLLEAAPNREAALDEMIHWLTLLRNSSEGQALFNRCLKIYSTITAMVEHIALSSVGYFALLGKDLNKLDEEGEAFTKAIESTRPQELTNRLATLQVAIIDLEKE